MLYPGNNYPATYLYQGDRQFFIPFLLGGLAGSAVVGLSRPRPVYAYNNYPMNFNPALPYGNYSYSYYYPTFPR